MDIIQEFESKIKTVGGEKVYSARDIMKIFGYDKWERFMGAIHRAMGEIIDQKTKNENFFFSTNKTTGGRPREDVLLTLGACYLVLKKCDERKDNVKILKAYLDDILTQKKYEQRKAYFFEKINMEKIFILGSVFFLLFSVGFYLKNYTDFLYLKNTGGILDYSVSKKEILEQKNKQEMLLKDYDQKVFPLESASQEVIPAVTFESILSDYIAEIPQKGILKSFELSEYRDFLEGFNLRTSLTQTFSGISLIQAYFELGNQGAYRDSCSLLSKKLCLSGSKTNLIDFSNFWGKTLAGYTLQDVKIAQEGENKNIYCVQYRYKLKNDMSNESITETFNFTTDKKDGYEQIVGRFCEKIEKGGREISCPFALQTYYCK